MTKHEWKNLYHEQIRIGVCYCALCGKKIEKIKDFSIDHATSRAQGGADDESNWLPAHKEPCNREKGALTLEQYREWKRLELIRNGQVKTR